MANERLNIEVPASKGDIDAALAAGAALGSAQGPYPDDATENSGAYAVVPRGYELVSLEQFLPSPLHISEHVSLQDADSFIAYVNDFKTAELSRLFFDVDQEEFLGVLDYHAVDAPAWCAHQASFKPRRSEEFKIWMANNRKVMPQVDFARFLEENLPDVVEPNSADLLAVALTFEAKKSVDFSSGVRLASGQIQFQFDETVRGTAQKGTIEVPEQFVLGISIHVNGPAYRIPVRLRWRIQEAKLNFWYEVVRPHRFIEDALREIGERVTNEVGMPVLTGSRK
jgi:uncharacterized protein YfdQ (DUF2303 family)